MPADDCVSMGDSIISTSCSAFVSTFENAADNLSNATDAQLASYLDTVPAPSPGCCSAAAPFVDEACQCNASLIGLAGFYGLTPEGVITSTYLSPAFLTKYTMCMLPDFLWLCMHCPY